MDFSDLFNDLHVYGDPTAYYPHMYGYYMQPMPVIRPPNESFYVHLKDAPQDQLPACVRSYRPKFNAKTIAERQQRANELGKQIIKQRVDQLSRRLAEVAVRNTDYHARENLKWLAKQDHIVEDMQEHQQRYQRKLKQRVAGLQAHNGQVQKRCEVLRYRHYLRSIAQQHDEKRKRRGIF